MISINEPYNLFPVRFSGSLSLHLIPIELDFVFRRWKFQLNIPSTNTDIFSLSQFINTFLHTFVVQSYSLHSDGNLNYTRQCTCVHDDIKYNENLLQSSFPSQI